MRKTTATERPVLPVLALLVFAAAADTQTVPSPPPPPKTPYLAETVRSSALGEDRRILIRLPRGYDVDTGVRYPVL